jgi:hypothetical protein
MGGRSGAPGRKYPRRPGGFSEGFGLGNGMVYAESTPARGRLGRDGPFLGNPGAAGGYRLVEKDRTPARIELSPGETGHGRDAFDPWPDAVLRRAKSGFFVPVRRWLAAAPAQEAGSRDHDWPAWARLVYRHHTGKS